MKTYYVFIDETGTSETKKDPQNFFAVGFLKIENITELNEKLIRKMYDYQSVNKHRRKKIFEDLRKHPRIISHEEIQTILSSTSHPEYKFSNITDRNIEGYKEFLDLALEFPLHFCSLVINKSDANFKSELYKNYWNAYITHSVNLCKNNCKEDERLIVIADYMTKPRSSTRIFEDELNKLDKVHGVIRAHSSTFPLIQLVDLFLGATVYQWRQSNGTVKDSNRAKSKIEFTNYLVNKLIIPSNKRTVYPLAQAITINQPMYFSVWPFRL